MIPPIRSYATVAVPSREISPQISGAVPDFPTVISDLISQYAEVDYSGALQPLSKIRNDEELNQAIKEAFASPICAPQLKVDIILQAIDHQYCDQLKLLLAELLDSGQDVYLNNIRFYRHGCNLGWLFARKNLIGKSILLPNFGKVHFNGAKLSFVNLEFAYLPRAVFKGASFSMTNLGGAFLYAADFSGTNVTGSNFATPECTKIWNVEKFPIYLQEPAHTNLSYASFTNSDVAASDFSRAILAKTNFTGAKNLDKASFDDADISGITLTEPDTTLSSLSQWEQIYVLAHHTAPTASQLEEFTQLLAAYPPEQLLECAFDIGRLGDRFSYFVEFSRLPGGQNCLKNLFLIKHGIFPSELQMYNEFRNGGASREVTIGLIRANRQPA